MQDFVAGFGLVVACLGPGLLFGLIVVMPLLRESALIALPLSRGLISSAAVFFFAAGIRALLSLLPRSAEWDAFALAVAGGFGAAALVRLIYPQLSDDDMLPAIQERRLLKHRARAAAAVGGGAAWLAAALASATTAWVGLPAIAGGDEFQIASVIVAWQTAVACLLGILAAELSAARTMAGEGAAPQLNDVSSQAGEREPGGGDNYADARPTPACAHCGYWLRAFTGDHCPECGEPIDWEMAWSGESLTPRHLVLRWARVGVISGAMSAAVIGLAVLMTASLMWPLMMLAFILLLVAPAICFGMMVLGPLLQDDGPVLHSRIRAISAALSTWLVGITIVLFGTTRDSPLLLALSAAAAGALSALALEHYLARQAHPILTLGQRRSLRDLFNELLKPIVSSRRPLLGACVGGAAAGIPIGTWALLNPMATIPDVATLGGFLCITATFALWQAGIAATLGLFTARLNPLATSAPESVQSPPHHP
ncbi:MAG: hypothetical protein IT430_02230 [Phycisphaerales bacterium]|nr:hypothetical protein [Phycisphaerales bacterium]